MCVCAEKLSRTWAGQGRACAPTTKSIITHDDKLCRRFFFLLLPINLFTQNMCRHNAVDLRWVIRSGRTRTSLPPPFYIHCRCVTKFHRRHTTIDTHTDEINCKKFHCGDLVAGSGPVIHSFIQQSFYCIESAHRPRSAIHQHADPTPPPSSSFFLPSSYPPPEAVDMFNQLQ